MHLGTEEVVDSRSMQKLSPVFFDATARTELKRAAQELRSNLRWQ